MAGTEHFGSQRDALLGQRDPGGEVAARVSKAPKRQGWIRRLVGYMKPHKKNAYVAFGVAIGGQLIQSLLPVVQKVVIDGVITKHTRPLAPWLTLMIFMGVFTFMFAYLRRFYAPSDARAAFVQRAEMYWSLHAERKPIRRPKTTSLAASMG